MKGKWIFLLAAAVCFLTACTSTDEVASPPEMAAMPTDGAAEEQMTDPSRVTRAFYEWYLEYIGEPGSGEFRNPLVDGAFRTSEHLSPEFVARIDEILSSFEGGGYDPILLAQDVPVRIDVGEPEVSGNQAMVPVLRFWGGNPDPSPMKVNLVFQDQRWLIDSVAADLPEVMAPAGDPPAVVEAFYAWYLNYIGDPGTENFRNPLVNRAYQESPLLTEDLKVHIDELLDADIQEYGGIMGDPILCAQAIPTEVKADVTRFGEEGAAVVASTSFSNHMIGLDLVQEKGEWLISHITCSLSPESTAKIFYDWYLGYIGDRSGEFRNPLVDRAYRGHPLLSETLEQEIDAFLDAREGPGFDPFLLAQDLPQSFSVEPGVVNGTAVVHFTFSPISVNDVLVTVEGTEITAIREAPQDSDIAPISDTRGWLAYSDSELGFTFSFPTEWVLEEEDLNDPGMPDDWPVIASWRLMPQDVAVELAAQSSPPDPTAPIVVSPIQIEVVVGDEAQLNRVYPQIEGELATYNGAEATLVNMDPGYTHTIFAHPFRDDLWLVLTDWVTGFPGREDQVQATTPVAEGVRQSIVFTQ